MAESKAGTNTMGTILHPGWAPIGSEHGRRLTATEAAMLPDESLLDIVQQELSRRLPEEQKDIDEEMVDAVAAATGVDRLMVEIAAFARSHAA